MAEVTIKQLKIKRDQINARIGKARASIKEEKKSLADVKAQIKKIIADKKAQKKPKKDSIKKMSENGVS